MSERIKKTKELCIGCKDNFYNNNNDLGVKNCWNYSSARIVDVVIAGIYEQPPYQRKEKALSCYKKNGYAYIENFDTIKKGKYKGYYCISGGKNFWENEDK